MRPFAIVLALAALALPAGSPAARPPLLVGDGGLPAAVRAGAARYFAWIDARGGVNGRPIAFRTTAPGEQPLVVLTTAAAAEPVPQLVLSGSAAARGRAWAVGYVPGYRLEASVLARQLARTRPGARIAVLYSDDADGRELLGWFRRLADVAVASADAAVVRASGADTLVVLSSRPLLLLPRDWFVYANAAAAEPAAGAVSTVYARTPGDPAWARDPTPARLRPANAEQALGLAAAYSVVNALRRAGSIPTRATVLTALRRSAEADNPFLVPGIVVRGGIHQVALQRRITGRWRVFTPPLPR